MRDIVRVMSTHFKTFAHHLKPFRPGYILAFNSSFTQMMGPSRVLCPFGALVLNVLRNQRHASARCNKAMNGRDSVGPVWQCGR